MSLRKCRVEYEQWNTETVRLDCLTNTPVYRIWLNYTKIEIANKVRK